MVHQRSSSSVPYESSISRDAASATVFVLPGKWDLLIRELPRNLNHFLDKVSMENLHVRSGGYFSPKLCNESASIRESVAIILPYRNRQEHLYTFLQHMHPILTRQRLEYKIYLVNQDGKDPFNRGKLINIGFTEAMKDKKWGCIIMHDVDYMPLNDNNLYTCWKNLPLVNGSINMQGPTELSSEVLLPSNQNNFKVSTVSLNEYYGWGAEDDDLAKRISYKGMHIDILDENEGLRIGKYKMLPHKEAHPAEDRLNKLEHAWSNMKKNGLNNLKYKIISKKKMRHCTLISQSISFTIPQSQFP
ncbi:B4GALT1 [Lepeophtheirus salmonis]|uniref:Beta-1,4-N-acetylgalactosaminyltransferase n=1 Tax=Lepeophtheirus salmonis TaxID=72036 RepID=A0A7R8CEE1_LEPSM|nr:B4GALT1 [Lepeophtheirus salmonis]CAF2752093.1 B4GALT1 [Lepeophtheirus salmonis]